MDGGYDSGYLACPCFWGREPGSLVRKFVERLGSVRGLEILDAGCGEGKNAIFLASHGALVRAVEMSQPALDNARAAWGADGAIRWELGDARTIALPADTYDVVIAYGLLHCLASAGQISTVIERLQAATKGGGVHVICAFNGRRQEFADAHPGFHPCTPDHQHYLDAYRGWEMLEVSDTDLVETHPHNNVRHTHSMTRLIARKP
jgi:cyclopropane fatty-acyl-phospholipid synthase-like methyltransferase